MWLFFFVPDSISWATSTNQCKLTRDRSRILSPRVGVTCVLCSDLDIVNASDLNIGLWKRRNYCLLVADWKQVPSGQKRGTWKNTPFHHSWMIQNEKYRVTCSKILKFMFIARFLMSANLSRFIRIEWNLGQVAFHFFLMRPLKIDNYYLIIWFSSLFCVFVHGIRRIRRILVSVQKIHPPFLQPIFLLNFSIMLESNVLISFTILSSKFKNSSLNSRISSWN